MQIWLIALIIFIVLIIIAIAVVAYIKLKPTRPTGKTGSTGTSSKFFFTGTALELIGQNVIIMPVSVAEPGYLSSTVACELENNIPVKKETNFTKLNKKIIWSVSHAPDLFGSKETLVFTNRETGNTLSYSFLKGIPVTTSNPLGSYPTSANDRIGIGTDRFYVFPNPKILGQYMMFLSPISNDFNFSMPHFFLTTRLQNYTDCGADLFIYHPDEYDHLTENTNFFKFIIV